MQILLVGASPAVASMTHHLLTHIGDRLVQRGHAPVRLQLSELPAQPLLHADCTHAAIARMLDEVAEAEALVLATPVYKRAYSGMLKVFLDLLGADALAGKIVLPVATGEHVTNMLDLDYALRPVLAAAGATHVLTSIYAGHEQLAWSTEQGLLLAPTIGSRVNYAVNELSSALLARQRQRQRVRRTARTEAPAAAMRQLA